MLPIQYGQILAALPLCNKVVVSTNESTTSIIAVSQQVCAVACYSIWNVDLTFLSAMFGILSILSISFVWRFHSWICTRLLRENHASIRAWLLWTTQCLFCMFWSNPYSTQVVPHSIDYITSPRFWTWSIVLVLSQRYYCNNFLLSNDVIYFLLDPIVQLLVYTHQRWGAAEKVIYVPSGSWRNDYLQVDTDLFIDSISTVYQPFECYLMSENIYF